MSLGSSAQDEDGWTKVGKGDVPTSSTLNSPATKVKGKKAEEKKTLVEQMTPKVDPTVVDEYVFSSGSHRHFIFVCLESLS